LEFQKENGQHLIQAFALPTEIGRYDTTSVNVHHSAKYKSKGLLNFGHSKDKRPDLLQFKQGLGALGNSQIIKYPFQKCPRKDLSGFENLTGLGTGVVQWERFKFKGNHKGLPLQTGLM